MEILSAVAPLLGVYVVVSYLTNWAILSDEIQKSIALRNGWLWLFLVLMALSPIVVPMALLAYLWRMRSE